jgi:hypothetical protein
VTSSLDVQVLQTSASLENLAVAAYAAAARLPAIRASDPALLAFIARTRIQHAAHAAAFNTAAVRAGGGPQHKADPRYSVAVSRALAGPNDAASVVSLLESLEDLKAQSYTSYAGLAGPRLRGLFVSVAGVEAAHRSILVALAKLLGAGMTDLIADGPASGSSLSGWPGAIGAGSLPDAFYPTAQASAIDEGAVR